MNWAGGRQHPPHHRDEEVAKRTESTESSGPLNRSAEVIGVVVVVVKTSWAVPATVGILCKGATRMQLNAFEAKYGGVVLDLQFGDDAMSEG